MVQEKIKLFFIFILIGAALFFEYKSQAFYTESGIVNVYSISVIQPDPNNTNYVDGNAIPLYNGKTTDFVKNYINSLNTLGINRFSLGTAYKKYNNINSSNYLNYVLIGTKHYVENVKKGIQINNTNTYRPDYYYYLSRENICDLVDNKNVKQIWVWTHHNSDIEPVETKIMPGLQLKYLWNTNGYGDLSNGDGPIPLPVCDNTYTLYGFNFTRNVADMLEDHTHRIEWLVGTLNNALFWEKFVGVVPGSPLPTNPGCGWTHYPPNGSHDYDWMNYTQVLSDCEDWKPDRTGTKKLVNCTAWSKSSTCIDDNGESFKVWWMQSIPGKNNNLIDTNGKKLRNWWELVENFDKVMEQNTKLYSWVYGDFNNDSINNSLDSAVFISNLFSPLPKIYMDLNDDNIVGLNDLILQLNTKQN